MTHSDLHWPTLIYNDLLKWLTIKEKDKRGSGWRVWWAENSHYALSRNAFSPITGQPIVTTAITHFALKAEINCEKTLGWFSFVLKLNWKCTNIKALLGNDKILRRAGKNEENICINKLFFPQCFVWFRVHNENVRLAQQRGFYWFKVQSGMFLTSVLQTCCSALRAANYLLF